MSDFYSSENTDYIHIRFVLPLSLVTVALVWSPIGKYALFLSPFSVCLLQEVVGPDNIPGFDKVVNLAQKLCSFTSKGYVPNQDAQAVIRLWGELHDYDKAPTVFPVRTTTAPPRGTFRKKKGPITSVPGVEVTARYVNMQPPLSCAFWTQISYSDCLLDKCTRR